MGLMTIGFALIIVGPVLIVHARHLQDKTNADGNMIALTMSVGVLSLYAGMFGILMAR